LICIETTPDFLRIWASGLLFVPERVCIDCPASLDRRTAQKVSLMVKEVQKLGLRCKDGLAEKSVVNFALASALLQTPHYWVPGVGGAAPASDAARLLTCAFNSSYKLTG
jgi:hypothetical protein